MQPPKSDNNDNLSPASPRRFLLTVVLWLLVTYVLAGSFAGGVLWHALVAIVVIALPLVCFVLYQRVMARTLRHLQYRRTSLFYRIFSGRLVSLVVALLTGLPGAVFLLIRLHVFSWQQWLLMLCAAPVFWIVYHWVHGLTATQYRPWLVTMRALGWSRILTPALLSLVYLLLTFLVASDVPDAGTLADAIERSRMQVADLQGSVALRFTGEMLMIADGMLDYAIHYRSAGNSYLMWLAAAFDAWLVFWLACTVFSAFMLPAPEWRRILVPLTDSSTPPAVSTQDLVLGSAVASFLLLFVFLPLVALIETEARNNQPVQRAPEVFVLQLERIGDDWYKPGTSQQLEQARTQVLDESGAALQDLRTTLDIAFNAVESNVEIYLDWYYSLGGEYARIGHLLSGDLEQYMADRLIDSLQWGDVFGPVQTALDAALDGNALAAERYAVLARSILAGNRVDPGTRKVEPLLQLELASVLEAPVHRDLINLQSRLLAGSSGSAVAGVMTGAVAAKLGSRMITKGSFKLAAKALGKLLASKTAGASLGAGAGAAAGAAAGSVVPGIGTAIGAIIGGIAGGLMVGIGIDKALIEFEEAVSRESFRTELLATIEEVRNEFAVP